MKTLITASAVLSTCLFAATAYFAEGHSGTEVAVPANLCEETKQAMAHWAIGKPVYSAYSVPTGPGECGQKGPTVTAGIATNAGTAREAQRASLETCNANRGNFGPCVVIATVRPKSQ
jgi:hypothetical protein